VKTHSEAELELRKVSPIYTEAFAAPLSLRGLVCPIPQQLQAGLDGEEEESRAAELATLLDTHRARHLHGFAAQVAGRLEVNVHALDDVNKLGGARPTWRGKRSTKRTNSSWPRTPKYCGIGKSSHRKRNDQQKHRNSSRNGKAPILELDSDVGEKKC